MQARFDVVLPFVIGEEVGPYVSTGGYVSAERALAIHDSGGETYKGIARNRNADWPGWAIIDQLRLAPEFPYNLPKHVELNQLVTDRYRDRYWNLFHCDELPPGLDAAMCDAAVQHRPKTAVSLIQRAVGAPADGVMGPGTIAAAKKAVLRDAVHRYFVLRAMFYMDIIVADANLLGNREGWFSRLFHLHALIQNTTPEIR